MLIEIFIQSIKLVLGDNMATQIVKVGSLKEGKLVVIDGEPCKITSIQISKPGKHGSAKARVEGVSLFTGAKKTLLKGTGDNVEIPVVEKKQAQVIAKLGENLIQVMDLSTYETYEIEVPDEFRDKIDVGSELDIHEIMGKKLIVRVR